MTYYFPVKAVVHKLASYFTRANEAKKTITHFSLLAAGANAVGGVIPGLVIPVIIISCSGTAWMMYRQLYGQLGFSMKENVLKHLVQVVLASIAANLAGTIAFRFAGELVEDASIPASAITAFLTVFLAGLVSLKLITKPAEKKH